MKKILLLLVSFSTVTLAMAQQKQSAAVAAAVEQLRSAMVSGNADSLMAVSSVALSYGHSGGSVENQAQFVEKIASGKSDFVSIELKNQTIAIHKNVAVVRHELHAKTNDNNVAGEVHLRILLVFQKEGKAWKLLARQAVKM
ncbi:nuclear transport factor 2 family protein [Phnomibacter sp. MR]|uniref:nuclear transport factor 2 family protein n=1 Tax=Phnomibacter sp. MR TaxID=3042318 RepID=UPI003A802604